MSGDAEYPTGVETTCGERPSQGASPTVIETERLVLRPFRDEDYDDLFEFLSQLESDEFEGYPGITYENGRTCLAQRVGSDEFLAIELASSGKVIGNLSCGKRDFEAREVGYIVNERYRRQGYAAEELTALIDHVFGAGVHRVYAECDPRNVASWRLLERVGLRREARFRQNTYFLKDEYGRPVWKDTYVYALLCDEWVGVSPEDGVCAPEEPLGTDG